MTFKLTSNLKNTSLLWIQAPGTSSIAKFFQPKDYSVIRAETLMIQFWLSLTFQLPGKHHLRGFKIRKKNRLAATRLVDMWYVHRCQENITYGGSNSKKIGSPLRGSWICDMCIDARKTSLTGVQNSKKNRLAATRLVDDAPPWKKARSAAGMWGKNLFFFVMLLPRGKILISSAKYWFLGMRILKSSNTTWQLCECVSVCFWKLGR